MVSQKLLVLIMKIKKWVPNNVVVGAEDLGSRSDMQPLMLDKTSLRRTTIRTNHQTVYSVAANLIYLAVLLVFFMYEMLPL